MFRSLTVCDTNDQIRVPFDGSRVGFVQQHWSKQITDPHRVKMEKASSRSRLSSQQDSNGFHDHDENNSKDESRRRNRRMKTLALFVAYVTLFGICIYYGLLIVRGPSQHYERHRWTNDDRNSAGQLKQLNQDNHNRSNQNRVHDGIGNANILKSREVSRKSMFQPIFPPIRDENGRIIMTDPLSKPLLSGRIRDRIDFKGLKGDDSTQQEWEIIDDTKISNKPKVDYTELDRTYPDMLYEVPKNLKDYPTFERLGDILERWPQDELENPPIPFNESLLHFDYTNSVEMKAAEKFRDAMVPFKVYNVPDILLASKKWSNDKYVADGFSEEKQTGVLRKKSGGAKGHCQKSKSNFFCFFIASKWNTNTMGPPPTMDNTWTYSKWAKHARYADRESISPDSNHYYFQAGVPVNERFSPKSDWSFISRDLPSISTPEKGFFMWNPDANKGIQCRFGERGVTAATHFDSGTNMVAMIVGAKRYILAPPIACPHLAIETEKNHPTFRHSQLNFARYNSLKDESIVSTKL